MEWKYGCTRGYHRRGKVLRAVQEGSAICDVSLQSPHTSSGSQDWRAHTIGRVQVEEGATEVQSSISIEEEVDINPKSDLSWQCA